MAIIQPKFLHDATPGELYLHDFFYKHLANDVYVYHEKNTDTLLPDFIIVDPSTGVMIIEVKDWDIDFWMNTIVATKENFTIHDKASKNPKNQALMYQNKLYALLRNSMSKRTEHKSKLRTPFPVNHLVAFPHLTQFEFRSLFEDEDKMKSILDPKFILFKDDFDRIDSSETPKADLRSLIQGKRYHKFATNEDRISINDMKCITAAIDPKVIIGGSPDGLFKSMAQLQIAEASFIPNHNRILRGIAGSGKSLMLLHQIDYICKHTKDKKILLVNYTNSLRATYREQYNDKEYSNVSVLGLAKARNFNEYLFDYIFIDESQDFSKDELIAIINKRKSADNSFVTMCTDWGQHLYTDEEKGYTPFNYTFDELGIDISTNDVIDLTINYRNTRQIAVLAHNFLHDKSVSMSTEDHNMNNMFLTEMKSALRDGRKEPELLECDNAQIAIDNIVARVFDLVSQGVDLNDIAILVHTKNGKAEEPVANLNKRLSDHRIATFSLLDNKNKGEIKPDDHILLSTIHSAKGFEYKHVLLYANLNVSQLYEVNKRLLYVGLTRAQETLTVVVDDQNSAITKLLKRSFLSTKELLQNNPKKYLDTSSVNEAHLKYQQAFKRIRNIILMIKSSNVLEHLEPIFDICKSMGFDVDSFESCDGEVSAESPRRNHNGDMKSLDEYNGLLVEKEMLERKHAEALIATESNKKSHKKDIAKSSELIKSLDDKLDSANETIRINNSNFDKFSDEYKSLQTKFDTVEGRFEKSEEDLRLCVEEHDVLVESCKRSKRKYNWFIFILLVVVLILAIKNLTFPAINMDIDSRLSWNQTSSVDSNVRITNDPYSILGSIYYVPAKFNKIKNDLEFPVALDDIKTLLPVDNKKGTHQGSYTTIHAITDPTNGNGKLIYKKILAETFFEGSTLEFYKDNDTGETYIHVFKYNKGLVEDIKMIPVGADAIGIEFSFKNEFAVYCVGVGEVDLFEKCEINVGVEVWLDGSVGE